MNKIDEQFKKEISLKFPNLEILNTYTDHKCIIDVKCKIHDYYFSKKAALLLHSKHGCNKCATESIKNHISKTNEWFVTELCKNNPTITPLEEYINMYTKIKVKCNNCGKEYYAKPNDLINGHACKDCSIIKISISKQKSHDVFIQQFNDNNPFANSITILSKYVKSSQKIKCRCNVCGYEWETYPNTLVGATITKSRSGTGCPICRNSHGEQIIYNYLVQNNYNVIRQKEFEGLLGLGGFPLTYDFFLPDYNILIEVNGIQHYKQIEFFGGKEKFNKQKEHDYRKQKYAKNHGYDLIEIKYYGENYSEENLIMQLNSQINTLVG